EVLVVVLVDLHHRRGAAAREALGGAQRDLAVRRRLARLDAETLLAIREQVARTAERAGQGAADPDLVLADLLLVEERVEGDDALHVSRREIEPVRDPRDHVVVDVPVLLLAEMERGN